MPLPSQDRGSRALSASLTWAASLGLFAWGGFWLDTKVGTKPLFMLVGCALGGIGGFLHFLTSLAPELLPWGNPKASRQAPQPPQGSTADPQQFTVDPQGSTVDPQPMIAPQLGGTEADPRTPGDPDAHGLDPLETPPQGNGSSGDQEPPRK